MDAVGKGSDKDMIHKFCLPPRTDATRWAWKGSGTHGGDAMAVRQHCWQQDGAWQPFAPLLVESPAVDKAWAAHSLSSLTRPFHCPTPHPLLQCSPTHPLALPALAAPLAAALLLGVAHRATARLPMTSDISDPGALPPGEATHRE